MCRWNILLRSFILAGVVGGDRLFHKFPVYVQILERDIFCSANPVFTFLDVIEAAVFHAYIINVLVIIKSDDEYTEFALLASHVFEVYVAHGRGIAAIALFPVFVLQVDAQYGFAALADGDVAYKYILYQSAAAGTGLDSDYAVQVGAVHAAVLNEQVTVAAGYFTADNDAAMTVFHEAAAHDDIFAGNVPLASVLVTAGFDGYAVVARIEGTVFYQYVFAGFRVAAVSVGSTVEYVHATYDEAFAKQRMYNPERRVQQGYILYQHRVAGIEVDELRTHAVFGFHDTLVYRRGCFPVHQQTFASAVALGHHAFFPAVARSAAHRPPGFVGTLTVDCPFAGDGDVGFAVCIYQRAGIVAVQTFPTGDDGREVKALVGGEFQYGSFFHMKIYVAL